MSQQDFTRFKERIRDWLENHLDIYDDFIDEMNTKPFRIIKEIYKIGLTLTPQLMRKARQSNHGDIFMTESQFQDFIGDDNLAEDIVRKFETAKKGTIHPALTTIPFLKLNRIHRNIIPCILSWIYFGKCYEMLIYFLEKEINTSNNFSERLAYKTLIKYLIWGSTISKTRTKENWAQWKTQLNEMKNGNLIIENALKGLSESNNEDKCENIEKKLSDYLIDCEEKTIYRIKERIKIQHEGFDIAHLYIALQTDNKIGRCNLTKFHSLLQKELPDLELSSVRNFQIAVKKLKDQINGKPLYEIGEDKIKIESWKTYLFDETKNN